MKDSILHTPLRAEAGEIFDARGHGIADTWAMDDAGRMHFKKNADVHNAFENERLRAAEIVRMVNLHDELVEALRVMIAMRDKVDPEGLFDGVEMIRARAVLAKVEG